MLSLLFISVIAFKREGRGEVRLNSVKLAALSLIQPHTVTEPTNYVRQSVDSIRQSLKDNCTSYFPTTLTLNLLPPVDFKQAFENQRNFIKDCRQYFC